MGVINLVSFISCVITPCTTIGGTRPYLNSNYVSMTHQMGAIISLGLFNPMLCIGLRQYDSSNGGYNHMNGGPRTRLCLKVTNQKAERSLSV